MLLSSFRTIGCCYIHFKANERILLCPFETMQRNTRLRCLACFAHPGHSSGPTSWQPSCRNNCQATIMPPVMEFTIALNKHFNRLYSHANFKLNCLTSFTTCDSVSFKCSVGWARTLYTFLQIPGVSFRGDISVICSK